ncbi:hypothetical protein ACSNOI_24320 [Actinomadura kijaniata]|uniref:hypothetical protein n=1 Tax=Actinomadura kijaniata TaxID=46161 RepID=UPI003F1B71F1
MTHFSARLDISYSQFSLDGGGWDPDQVDYTGGNGLLWSGESALVVFTGLDTGHVPLSITVTQQAPPPELDGWDEVVEVSLAVTDDTLVLCSPAGEFQHEVTLPATGQRSYRVRVQARGRDAGREAQFINADDAEPMVEEYQILLWPAPPAPEARLKLTDAVGADNRTLA